MNLNSATTSNQYQSTFMPIFSDAEARIKQLVVFAFWTGMPKSALVFQIGQIISQVKKQVPTTLYDRDQYINGLVRSSQKIIKDYERANSMFIRTKRLFRDNHEIHTLTNPQKLSEYMKKHSITEQQRIWSTAKGSPNVYEYQKELRKFINNVSDHPFTTIEKGKKPISLWQKAELDVRYNKQMEHLQELLDKNVEYAWISSHPDCSERCAIFQGELVSLKKHAKNPQKSYKRYKDIRKESFVCGELDGHKVYSLPDIKACVDKYGYHNMIISGFNCRHKLEEYKSESVAPTHYSASEIKKQREIEQNIRLKERNIRLLKMKMNDYTIIDDKQAISALTKKTKLLTNEYKRYCESNGYAWYKYRIDVTDNRIYLRSN